MKRTTRDQLIFLAAMPAIVTAVAVASAADAVRKFFRDFWATYRDLGE